MTSKLMLETLKKHELLENLKKHEFVQQFLVYMGYVIGGGDLILILQRWRSSLSGLLLQISLKLGFFLGKHNTFRTS